MLGYPASLWESTANSTIPKWEPVVSALAYYGAADATPPAAVVLKAPAMAGQAVELDWEVLADPQSGIAGYEIYRDSVPGAAKLLRKIEYNAPHFLDSGVAAKRRYAYRIKAVNRKGMLSAGFSNEVAVTAGIRRGCRGRLALKPSARRRQEARGPMRMTGPVRMGP